MHFHMTLKLVARVQEMMGKTLSLIGGVISLLASLSEQRNFAHFYCSLTMKIGTAHFCFSCRGARSLEMICLLLHKDLK